MDEEVDIYFTRKCASVETRLCLQAAPFRNQWGNQQSAMSIRKLSVVRSTDLTATKWWYNCVRWEWSVSIRVRSVGRVGHGSQGEGGLVANASQKASQIPFFEYQNNWGKANRRLFNIHLFYTQSESSNNLENWYLSSDGEHTCRCSDMIGLIVPECT